MKAGGQTPRQGTEMTVRISAQTDELGKGSVTNPQMKEKGLTSEQVDKKVKAKVTEQHRTENVKIRHLIRIGKPKGRSRKEVHRRKTEVTRRKKVGTSGTIVRQESRKVTSRRKVSIS